MFVPFSYHLWYFLYYIYVFMFMLLCVHIQRMKQKIEGVAMYCKEEERKEVKMWFLACKEMCYKFTHMVWYIYKVKRRSIYLYNSTCGIYYMPYTWYVYDFASYYYAVPFTIHFEYNQWLLKW